ncbi:DUF3040 domain-containing protein [Amycolatopsis sp. NPDC051903]|uniref:DUF3040 domain-containing protein n=1 Tax=Amycolatopsis sp. NPDC051903 TaxID=3363936 RepID=UPI0037984AC3
MLDERDRRALLDIEADLRPQSFTARAFAVGAAAGRISWFAVLVLADVTAVLTLLTGVFAARGGFVFAGFLAGFVLVVVHTVRVKRR